MERVRVIIEQLQSHPRIKQLRDVIVLIAVLRFAGDIHLALTELGLFGALRAIVLYPIIKTWTYAKKNVSFIKGIFWFSCK